MRAGSDGFDGLVYLYNIPAEYHARDLRSFFSQFIEALAFTCFHFRHRKELPLHNLSHESSVISSSSIVSIIHNKNRRMKTLSTKLCCLVSLPKNHIGEFIRAYAGMHWLSTTDDNALPDQCLIRPVQFNNPNDSADISELIELKPPEWMPQGNVGTPTSHFFNLIKCCQLDSSIIRKLKLDFCQSHQRTYSAVPYDYGDNHSQEVMSTGLPLGEVRTQRGLRIVSEDEYLESQTLEGISSDRSSKYPKLVAASDKLSDDYSDEPAEDWERFESLHDDPYKVERGDRANIKYQDKVELVWEKGGSGLVFHTDEYTWRKLDPLRKEEFFDEPASLDWDIDVEAYESPQHFSVGPRPTGHWGMARDTSDLIDMNRKKDTVEHRESSDPNPCVTLKTLDKYGPRLLRRMGWWPGHPVAGSKRPVSSLADILPSPCPTKAKDLPHRGLGYHGPRIIPSSSVGLPSSQTCPTRSVYIRTAFDQPSFAKARTESTWQWPSLPDRQSRKEPAKTSPGGDNLPQQQQSLSSVRSRTIILSRDDEAPLSREGISFVSGGLLRPVTFRIMPPRQCLTPGYSSVVTID